MTRYCETQIHRFWMVVVLTGPVLLIVGANMGSVLGDAIAVAGMVNCVDGLLFLLVRTTGNADRLIARTWPLPQTSLSVDYKDVETVGLAEPPQERPRRRGAGVRYHGAWRRQAVRIELKRESQASAREHTRAIVLGTRHPELLAAFLNARIAEQAEAP